MQANQGGESGGFGLVGSAPLRAPTGSFGRAAGAPKVLTVAVCQDVLMKTDGQTANWLPDIYELPQLRGLGPMIEQIRVHYVAENASANFSCRVTTAWSVLGKTLGGGLPSLAATPRLLVGVPSGVVRGDYLYVYYTVAPGFNFSDRGGNPSDSTTKCFEGTQGGDEVGDARASVNAYARALSTFQPGLAVKRIALADIDAHWTRSDEASWDYYEYHWGVDTTIPGDLLGMVRVFVPAPPGSLETGVRFEDAMCDGGNMVDPSAVLCPENERIALYFTFTKCRLAGTGGSLWRAREITLADATIIGIGLFFDIVPGRDFRVSVDWEPGGTGFTSIDRLADIADPEDPSGIGQFQNADAIRMRDGTWRVYSGGGWSSMFGDNQATLNLFTGDARDGGCT